MSWAMTALLVMSSTELVVSFNSGNVLPRQPFDPWLLLLRRAHRGLRHGWGVRVRGQGAHRTRNVESGVVVVQEVTGDGV